ncbi:MAG: FAD-binding oxidoreductase [Deltaproteobacteria bacterium]|nr:FAD-binding oxidoreductase [Deltaproteobacteria bacterium]
MSGSPTKRDGVLEAWGRVSRPAAEVLGEDIEAITEGSPLSRGLGRSYGDSALPARIGGSVSTTTLADRLIAFDPESGELHAEAGLSLREIFRIFLPRNFYVASTPGTSFVTLGGMVAADVHGKSHHSAGTIGRHVLGLKMRLADESIVWCTPQERSELFWATVGGMGLTGHILEVRMRLERLPSPWIWSRSERVPNLKVLIAKLHETAKTWPMSVAWIDTTSTGDKLGRGILDVGRWAEPGEAPSEPPRQKPRITMPDIFPRWLINPVTIRMFNFLWYWKHWQPRREGVVHPEAFFYPLDMLARWNRAYGRGGTFTQYQCVLPMGNDEAPVEFLKLLQSLGGDSFLTVVKDCGPEGQGTLSFPREGISLATDLRLGPKTQGIVDALNAFVIAEGGRIYLAKDMLTRPADYAAMDPRVEQFMNVRRRFDPELRLRSAQSVRLFGDPPEVS